MPPFGSERGEGEVRIRFRFTKLGKIRFTSQRDVARMWERALRRDLFPMAYTAGFSPRPQLSFGLALPTGCESLAEYLDVTVDETRLEAQALEASACPARLTPLLPDGIEVTAAGVPDVGADSLQELVSSCAWTVRVIGMSRAELEDRVSVALAADHLPILRQRKGRSVTDDLRPSILSLEVTGERDSNDREPGGADLVAELATKPRGVRPGELLGALFAPTGPAASQPSADGEDRAGPMLYRACRTNQWIECDGSRQEPLSETGGTPGLPLHPTPSLERAS